ncbi:putative hemolysin [Morganella morganii]|uniref:putative hemolysin n=1 Tax=Morganella morganii TaxID=582 RepID=UPI0028585F73|nr:DUF333 domain-containing protein [Morganella morganii]MDR5685247.1 DUF333 domain-containing protein [Morganella morganii]
MISVPFFRRPGRVLCSVIVAAAAFAAGCSSSPDTVQQKQVPRFQQPLIDLTEDARASCSYAGGTPSLIRELNGAQTPGCQFANGKRCSQQSLLSGSCGSVL